MDFYSAQITRCANSMDKYEPGTDEYISALQALLMLESRVEEINRTYGKVCTADNSGSAIDVITTAEKQNGNATEEIVTEEPTATEEVIPVKETPKVEEPVVTITKEEIRAKLGAYRLAGVKIRDLMDSIGYEKLSDVPAEKYGELLKLAEIAAGVQ